MLTDIEIAQSCEMQPIGKIADTARRCAEDLLEPYGPLQGEGRLQRCWWKIAHEPGKLVLVTAINPTPGGRRQDHHYHRSGRRAAAGGHTTRVVALREPSLGPVFGIKGGAAGGGYAQVVPMEDINLHFTGDIHAIAAANNLLAAMLDNQHPAGQRAAASTRAAITWKRCMDMNDRQLRNVVDGLGGKAQRHAARGRLRHHGGQRDHGDRSAWPPPSPTSRSASPASSSPTPTTTSPSPPAICTRRARWRRCCKDALKPEPRADARAARPRSCTAARSPTSRTAATPSSPRSTALASGRRTCVTEAGFGADLGAEKFLDIKCRLAGLVPERGRGGGDGPRAQEPRRRGEGRPRQGEPAKRWKRGLPNLRRHRAATSARSGGCRPVVALNRFTTDTDAEIELVRRAAAETGAKVALCEVWAKGGEGGRELARLVMEEARPRRSLPTFCLHLSG